MVLAMEKAIELFHAYKTTLLDDVVWVVFQEEHATIWRSTDTDIDDAAKKRDKCKIIEARQGRMLEQQRTKYMGDIYLVGV